MDIFNRKIGLLTDHCPAKHWNYITFIIDTLKHTVFLFSNFHLYFILYLHVCTKCSAIHFTYWYLTFSISVKKYHHNKNMHYYVNILENNNYTLKYRIKKHQVITIFIFSNDNCMKIKVNWSTQLYHWKLNLIHFALDICFLFRL